MTVEIETTILSNYFPSTYCVLLEEGSYKARFLLSMSIFYIIIENSVFFISIL